MCTAAAYKTKGLYFGRTLDYEFSYGEEITITPRKYSFAFKHKGAIESHYAMIGIAHIEDHYPLYYDAMNEKGLCMAGLNFVGNAKYQKVYENRDNIASFELIPWILAQCATLKEARILLEQLNITDDAFSEKLPPSQLHWIIADEKECITVEAVKDGLHIYENPVGVLTNNPPFDLQIHHLNNYMNLSAKDPEPLFCSSLSWNRYSRGMGAIGLPGDLSSESRFVRTAFVKMNSVSDDTEEESVNQFFHILGAVEQQRGCCRLENDKCEITIYTSCCSADKGIYYYTTYENHQIHAIDMKRENLDGKELILFPLVRKEQIKIQNS